MRVLKKIKINSMQEIVLSSNNVHHLLFQYLKIVLNKSSIEETEEFIFIALTRFLNSNTYTNDDLYIMRYIYNNYFFIPNKRNYGTFLILFISEILNTNISIVDGKTNGSFFRTNNGRFNTTLEITFKSGCFTIIYDKSNIKDYSVLNLRLNKNFLNTLTKMLKTQINSPLHTVYNSINIKDFLPRKRPLTLGQSSLNNIISYNFNSLPLDIDGLCGAIDSIDIKKNFNHGFNLEFGRKQQLLSKNFYIKIDSQIMSIKNIDSLFLGSIYSSIGVIKIFVCFKLNRTGDCSIYKKIYNQLSHLKEFLSDKLKSVETMESIGFLNTLRSLNINSDKIYGKICNGLGGIILAYISSIFPKKNTFFFFESFGNKHKTIGSNALEIIGSLSNIFNIKCLNNFNIDLNLSYIGKDTLNVDKYYTLKPEILEEFNLPKNAYYNLMFSKDVININQKLTSMSKSSKGNIKIDSKMGVIKKLNLYSPFFRYLQKISKEKHFIKYYSIAYINDLVNQNKDLESDVAVNILNIKNIFLYFKKLINDYSCTVSDFRMEITVSVFHLLDGLNFLLNYFQPSNFKVLSFSELKEELLSYIDLFASKIGMNTTKNIESLYNLRLIEGLFYENILMGNMNNKFLASSDSLSIKNILNQSNGNENKLQKIETLIEESNKLDISEKLPPMKKLFEHLIKYNSIPKKRHNVIMFIEVLEFKELIDICEYLVNNYFNAILNETKNNKNIYNAQFVEYTKFSNAYKEKILNIHQYIKDVFFNPLALDLKESILVLSSLTSFLLNNNNRFTYEDLQLGLVDAFARKKVIFGFLPDHFNKNKKITINTSLCKLLYSKTPIEDFYPAENLERIEKYVNLNYKVYRSKNKSRIWNSKEIARFLILVKIYKYNVVNGGSNIDFWRNMISDIRLAVLGIKSIRQLRELLQNAIILGNISELRREKVINELRNFFIDKVGVSEIISYYSSWGVTIDPEDPIVKDIEIVLAYYRYLGGSVSFRKDAKNRNYILNDIDLKVFITETKKVSFNNDYKGFETFLNDFNNGIKNTPSTNTFTYSDDIDNSISVYENQEDEVDYNHQNEYECAFDDDQTYDLDQSEAKLNVKEVETIIETPGTLEINTLESIPSNINTNEICMIENYKDDDDKILVRKYENLDVSINNVNVIESLKEFKIESNDDIGKEKKTIVQKYLNDYKDNANYILWFNMIKRFRGNKITISKFRKIFTSKARPSVDTMLTFFESLKLYQIIFEVENNWKHKIYKVTSDLSN